jgi:hypothetical protein
MSESDGIEETLEQVMRVSITAAARAGQAAARRRQQEAQRLLDESEVRAGQLQARADAEMRAARTAYAGVEDPIWWATASPRDVAAAYETATAWSDIDEAAARARDRIEQELRERYAVDPADGQDVGAGDRSDKRSEAEVAPLVAAAERADATVQPGWDTRERREQTARNLQSEVKDERAVEAKMRSDVAQAHPVTHATHAASGRANTARPGRGGQRQRTRSLER